MPDNKPVTAQEAVEAYNTIRKVCIQHENYGGNTICPTCPFRKNRVCMSRFEGSPSDWPDIKEAPHA